MLAAALGQRSDADAAVRESEQRWRLLLERMNEGLVMQDRDGLMTYVSDRFCEIIRLSARGAARQDRARDHGARGSRALGASATGCASRG